MSGHEACPVENGESSLPVCDGPDDSNCDSSFFTQLSQEKAPEEEDNDRGEEIDKKSKRTKMLYAYSYLKEVQEFLEQEGHVEEAFKLGSIIL